MFSPDLLRMWRERRGLTRYALAKRIGKSPQHVGRIERGIIRQPRPEMVQALAVALNVRPIDLLDLGAGEAQGAYPAAASAHVELDAELEIVRDWQTVWKLIRENLALSRFLWFYAEFNELTASEQREVVRYVGYLKSARQADGGAEVIAQHTPGFVPQ